MSESVSSGGFRTPGWTNVSTNPTVRARVVPRRFPLERLRAGRIVQEHGYDVWMWYRSDVTPQMQLRWGSKILTVHTVHNVDEQQRFIRLMCTEVDIEST